MDVTRDGGERWAGLDTTTAHPARRYNYWLGGKDNFAADRESGDQIERAYPSVRVAARENRAFLQRTVRHLAGEVGIRQFLDVGTGLPTADNTHEVAQRSDATARVVYVDNDPMVMTHARALLTSTPQGRTRYLEADLRDPDKILAHPDLRRTLDLDRPVGLMLVAVLHFVPAQEEAVRVVRRLLDALPSGSHLVVSHATLDFATPARAALSRQMQARGQTDIFARSGTEVAELFTGLDLVEPGIVPVCDWRPDAPDGKHPTRAQVAILGAVGRKP